MLAALAVLLLARAEEDTPSAFVTRCHQGLRSHQRLIVMDVGANNGNFSLQLIKKCSAALRTHGGTLAPRSLQLLLFEPNPILRAALAWVEHQAAVLEPPWHTEVITSAAWTVAGEMKRFYISNVSITSSMHQSSANRQKAYGRPESVREVGVTTFDLAAFLRDNVRTGDVAFMKLDIECVEWRVVPHLFTELAFCGLTFIRVEWHFHALCPMAKNVSLTRDFAPRVARDCNTVGTAPLHRHIDYDVDSHVYYQRALHCELGPARRCPPRLRASFAGAYQANLLTGETPRESEQSEQRVKKTSRLRTGTPKQ